MNRTLSFFLTGIALIISSLLIFINDSNADYIPGEIIVKFKQNTDTFLINALNSDTGSVKKKAFKKIRVHHIKLPDNLTVEEAVQLYQNDPNVEYAEPNYTVSINAIPDDSNFNNLWGLHNTGQTGGINDADTDMPEAWDLTTGSKSVVIAVVDTGVAYTHPDINANIWTNTGETSCADGIDNDDNGYIDDCNGWDFVGNDSNPMDFNGHGTHVAGIIASQGNNNEGITGVMWNAQIMPLRFLGINGSGTIADAVSAILYASTNGAHVLNLSWGGRNFSKILKDAIDASDAVVVCAAGNNGANNDMYPVYPASYTSPNIISVSASDANDDLAIFSNYGKESVDLAAPGVSIYSAIPEFSYGSPVTVYSGETFDSGSGSLPQMGWDSDNSNSIWAVTAGTGADSTNSLEDSPGSNYADNTSTWAGYMTPITSVKDNIYTLSFKWRGDLEDNHDYLDINYSLDGNVWDWIDDRTGTVANFEQDSTDAFTEIAEMFDSFYFGFGITSDSSVNRDGVYLDDIELTRKPILISSFAYKAFNGTSMSAPYVSGVAGLILAYKPGLTSCQVKKMIMDSVDVLPSFSDRVLAGGRLNAYNALRSDPADTCSNEVNEDSNESINVTNESVDSSGDGGGGGGGGCFIATAAYGSLMHPYVKALRSFRDRYLLTNTLGTEIVHFYYKTSPPIANVIRDSQYLKFITRVMLTPVVILVIFPYESLGVFVSLLVLTTITFRRFKKQKTGV